MEVKEISSPDAINASSFVMLKYVLEKLLDAANSNVDIDDPIKSIINSACEGRVEEDDFSQILMGYCVAEPEALMHNMKYAIGVLSDQITALGQNVGG